MFEKKKWCEKEYTIGDRVCLKKRAHGNSKCSLSVACVCVQQNENFRFVLNLRLAAKPELLCIFVLFFVCICHFEPDWSERARMNLFIALLDFVCRQLSLNALNDAHIHTTRIKVCSSFFVSLCFLFYIYTQGIVCRFGECVVLFFMSRFLLFLRLQLLFLPSYSCEMPLHLYVYMYSAYAAISFSSFTRKKSREEMFHFSSSYFCFFVAL